MSDPLRGFEPAPQDLVLTLLGAHHRPRESGTVWSGGLVRLLAEFGFSEGAARIALNRLVGRELLTRTKHGRQVSYTLTPRSVAVLAEGDRRIFTLGQRPATDTTWTVLWHFLPEDRRLARSRLVSRLRFLGFGSVQDGTWLAPHDHEQEVAALLAELDVAAHTGVMLGRPATSVDFGTFVTRAWDLDALAERYRAFVQQFADHRVADDRAAFLLRTRLVHTFREFASVDPELPEDIVAPPAHRAEALRRFHELYPSLAEAAQRHYDATITPDG